MCQPQWMQTGWKVLSRIADYPRDCLLPTPATCLGGMVQAELRYDTGFAILSRTLSAASLKDGSELPLALGAFWTPHSGRAFMPSASTALNFTREERLASSARVAKLRVQNMQRAVVRTLQGPAEGDPLGEAETFAHMEEFLIAKGCSEELRTKLLLILQRWDLVPKNSKRRAWAWKWQGSSQTQTKKSMERCPRSREWARSHRPRRSVEDTHWSRPKLWENNPRSRRAAIRATLQPGYYICSSGKRAIRTLHRLGACYASPDVDYLHYIYAGEGLPEATLYDTVLQALRPRDHHRS